ncbi:hypothetical protein EHZ64_13260 [Aeromonas enteropelogenes]|nr:hypothetical protein EHZ64_13260 [Aeromonas enteropelogenes]
MSEFSVSSQVHLPDNKKARWGQRAFSLVLCLLSDYRYSNDHTPACQGVCHHQMVRMEVVCMINSCKKMFAMKCLQKTIKPRPSQVAF